MPNPIGPLSDDEPQDDETPTVQIDQPWVGSASIPRERQPQPPRSPHDTLDLPVVERRALEEQPPPYIPPPYIPPASPARPRRSLSAPSPRSAMPARPGFPPPPPMAPPASAGPEPRRPRRKRRRWPSMFLVMTLLMCTCCGIAIRTLKPYVEQWPASITAGAEVSGLTITEDETRTERAKTLLDDIDAWYDQDSFTAIYVDTSSSNLLVTAFGLTRFIRSTDTTVDNALATLSDDLSLTGLHTVDSGTLGGEARCGSGTVESQSIIACSWADHGSLGVVMFTNREESDCVTVLARVRRAVIRR